MAAECIRYEAASKQQVFKLSGQGVNGLLSVSVDKVSAAIQEREENGKINGKCPPIAGGVICDAPFDVRHTLFKGIQTE